MTNIIHKNDIVDEVHKYTGEDSFHNSQYTLIARNVGVRFSEETNYVIKTEGDQIKTEAKILFDSKIGAIPMKSKIVKGDTEYIVEDTSRPSGITSPLYTKVLCRRLE